MDTNQIRDILKVHCPLFVGVFARDKLPRPSKRPMIFVANFDPSKDPGTHWVAVFLDDDGTGEYFDSYGYGPEGIFESYLNEHCDYWTYNSKRLQGNTSSTCGQYTIFYAIHRALNFDGNAIASMFTSSTKFNDALVANYVKKLKRQTGII